MQPNPIRFIFGASIKLTHLHISLLRWSDLGSECPTSGTHRSRFGPYLSLSLSRFRADSYFACKRISVIGLFAGDRDDSNSEGGLRRLSSPHRSLFRLYFSRSLRGVRHPISSAEAHRIPNSCLYFFKPTIWLAECFLRNRVRDALRGRDTTTHSLEVALKRRTFHQRVE